MGKKLTNRQNEVVRRVASNLGLSDQLVGTIVSEFLDGQGEPRKQTRAKKVAVKGKSTGKK